MKKNRIFHLLTNPIIISLFLLTILILISLNRIMGNDEGIWSYIGRVWSENSLPPYVGTMDNKTPGIFELYAISNILFGVNFFFLRGLGVISILLSSVTIYYIGRELHSHLAGIFGMYIFGLTMTWDLLDGGYTAQTETFMVLFSTLSFYFVIKRESGRKWKYWVLLAGISMGLSIAFKQIAITTSLALLIFILIYSTTNMTKQNKFFGIILLGLGISLSTLFSLIPLLFSGVSLKEYINGAWLFLQNPGSSTSFIVHFLGFFRVWQNSRIVIFYPFLFIIILQHDLVKKRYFIGLLAWLFFDFIGVNSAGTYYGHQIKQLIPPLSIIIGILLNNLLINFIDMKYVDTKYVSILIITIIIFLFPYSELSETGYKIATGYSNNHNPNKEIGTWLRDHTNKNEYVYMISRGFNPILSYSERVSSSKYFNSIFITSKAEKEILLSDLKAKPPIYILKPHFSDNIGDGIEEFIINNYSFQQIKYDIDIFKRN